MMWKLDDQGDTTKERETDLIASLYRQIDTTWIPSMELHAKVDLRFVKPNQTMNREAAKENSTWMDLNFESKLTLN